MPENRLTSNQLSAKKARIIKKKILELVETLFLLFWRKPTTFSNFEHQANQFLLRYPTPSNTANRLTSKMSKSNTALFGLLTGV